MNINNLHSNDEFPGWSESRSTCSSQCYVTWSSLTTRIVSSQFPLSTDTERVIHHLISLKCVCVFEYVLSLLLQWNTVEMNLWTSVKVMLLILTWMCHLISLKLYLWLALWGQNHASVFVTHETTWRGAYWHNPTCFYLLSWWSMV